jgi:hypothetical protein
MAFNLLQKWENTTGSEGIEFGKKVAMALAKRAGIELTTLAGGSGTEPTYNRYIKMANYVLSAGPKELSIFSRILASGGYYNGTDDADITQAIVDYWDTLSLLFDPNVP